MAADQEPTAIGPTGAGGTVDPLSVVDALRRAAVTLGSDAELMRLYSPEVVSAVLKSLAVALAGAGTLEVAADRMANDPALSHVPMPVVEALTEPCLLAFTRALKPEAAR